MSFLYKIIKYKNHKGVLTPIRDRYTPTSVIGLVLISLLSAISVAALYNLPVNPVFVPAQVIAPVREQPHQYDPYKDLTLVEVYRGTYTITAYNTVPEQTSGNPCISASGINICEGMELGHNYVACNFCNFGMYVEIEGKIYEVVDRTSTEFSNRIDIAMPADQIQEARDWGARELEVILYE